MPVPPQPQSGEAPASPEIPAFTAKVPLSTPPSTLRERAEDDANVTASLGTGRPVVQGDVVVEGEGAFHLANPDFLTENVTLTPSILPTASTKVFFESLLGYATEDQIARLQISTNNGGSWETLWSQAGADDAGESGFRLVSIPLDAYAGTSVRIRFTYVFTGGFAYTDVLTWPPVGWFIDDIQVGEHFIKRPYTLTGDPTPAEILTIEYINRARADAAAEAARLQSTTDPDVLLAIAHYGVNLGMMVTQFATLQQATQPLAMNARLLAASRLHSQDMLNNAFQGHITSANPPPPNQPGDTLFTRTQRQGYNYSIVAENIFSYAQNPWHAHAGFNIDWGGSPASGGMQDPPGHRLNIHHPEFREIGVGIVQGTNTIGTNTVGPLLVTHNFGTVAGGGQPFVTGVTYHDANGNNMYDPGEGLGGVTVEVDGSSYYSVSSTHGAYAVPVSGDGEYMVRFLRVGHPALSRTVTVSNNLNVKADYRGESVRVESVSFPAADAVRLVTAPALPGSTLTLRASGDLAGWTNIPHIETPLPDDRIQLDATNSFPTNRAFFAVEADWAAP